MTENPEKPSSRCTAGLDRQMMGLFSKKKMRTETSSAKKRFLEDKPVKFVNLSVEERFLEDKPVKFVNLSVGKRFLTDKWPTQAGLSVKCALFTDKAFNSEKKIG